MMKKKRAAHGCMAVMLALLFALTELLLAGCGPAVFVPPDDETTAGSETSAPSGTLVATELISAYDANDSWQEEAYVTLNLSDPASLGEMLVDGDVHINGGGVYLLTGAITGGGVFIDAGAEEKVWLVLAGTDISSPDSPAVLATGADKLKITLADGTENALSDGAEYTGIKSSGSAEEANAAIWCENDLTVNGTGTLTVTGNCNNGIGTKDDLKLLSGSITVSAVKNGLKGNDSVIICSGTVSVTAGNDAVKSDNEDVGKGYVLVTGGTVRLDAADDGIQAVNAVTLSDGSVTISSLGKAVNCDGDITVSPGVLTTLSHTAATEADSGTAEQEAGQKVETLIALNGDSAKITGAGAVVSGKDIVISEGGVYRVTGTLTDGRIVISAKGLDAELILDGVSITCSYSAALYVYKANSVIVTLPQNTKNTLCDGASYSYADEWSSEADGEPGATFFSKADLIIKGPGALSVTGNSGNAVHSKDTLTINGATLTVTAENHGISGKDSLTLSGCTLSVTALCDAVRSTNDTDTSLGWINIENSYLTVTAGEDGIQAETALTVTGGSITVKSGGGYTKSASTDSAKGIKAAGSLTLTDVTLSVNSADDAIHSNSVITTSGGVYLLASGDDGIHADTSITVDGTKIDITSSYEGIESTDITLRNIDIRLKASDDGVNISGGTDSSGFGGAWNRGGGGFWGGMGGTAQSASSGGTLTIESGYLYVDATGDGLDANGAIVMTGGTVIVNGPTNSANGALDYDSTFNISGGTLIAAGASGMAQTPSSSSTQNSVSLNASLAAGQTLAVFDANSKLVLAFTAAKSAQNIVISSPLLVRGASYSVYKNVTVQGTQTGGLYGTEATASGGTLLTSFTVSSVVTGSSGGQNPGGQNPGGQNPGGRR